MGANPLGRTDQYGLFFDQAGFTALLEGTAATAGVATSTVVAGATGILAAAFPSPAGEGSDQPPTQCKGDDDDDCQEILEKIREVMKELMRRYNHQCRDKKGQWESHLPAFEGKKIQLQGLVMNAESKGCPVPDKAYKWLATQCPAPGTNIRDNPSPGY